MDSRAVPPARLRRLAEELADEGHPLALDDPREARVLAELEYAFHPAVHERRIPSFGAIVAPSGDPAAWEAATRLTIMRRPMPGFAAADARRFADGLSTWHVAHPGDEAELVVLDRPAGSERDLVVLADALSAAVVQRHPNGTVRLVDDLGVLRWDGIAWHHEPPVASWIDAVGACAGLGDRDVLVHLLELAVHDLGSRGIGALLIYRPLDEPGPVVEERLPTPPALDIRQPFDLAALRHVLAQVDGAAVFDGQGVLRRLGVRLVPSPAAEADVAGFRGMRHTAARRYSFDDPSATVIVVSEDGPVTVLRNGELLGRSPDI